MYLDRLRGPRRHPVRDGVRNGRVRCPEGEGHVSGHAEDPRRLHVRRCRPHRQGLRRLRQAQPCARLHGQGVERLFHEGTSQFLPRCSNFHVHAQDNVASPESS